MTEGRKVGLQILQLPARYDCTEQSDLLHCKNITLKEQKPIFNIEMCCIPVHV